MLVVFYITKSFKCAGSFLSLAERRRPPVGTISGFFTSAIVVTSGMVGVLDNYLLSILPHVPYIHTEN